MTDRPCPLCGGKEFALAMAAAGGDPDAQSHFLRLAQRKIEHDQQAELLHAHNEMLTKQMNYYAHQAAYHRAYLQAGHEPDQAAVDACFAELEQARILGNNH